MSPTAPRAPQAKERRSRRSHKNSKDGCPNCRANRIKCSEDLPRCLQCTKKNYRCGYLDFPPDKLEHIRRKNDLLRRQRPSEIEQHTSKGSPSAAFSAPVDPPHMSPLTHSSYQLPQNQSQNQSQNHQNQPIQAVTLPPAYPQNLPAHTSPVGFPPRLDMPLYSQMPAHMAQMAQAPQPPVLVPSYRVDYGLPPSSAYAGVPIQGQPFPPQPVHFSALPPQGTRRSSSVMSPTADDLHRTLYPARRRSSQPQASFDTFPVVRPGVQKPIAQQTKARKLSSTPTENLPSSQRSVEESLPPKDPAFHSRKKIRIRENDAKAHQKPNTFSTNFRSVMYSNAFRDVTHDLTSLEKEVPPNFKPWVDGQPYGFDPKNPFFSSELSNIFETQSDGGGSAGLLDVNSVQSRSTSDTRSNASPSVRSLHDKFLPNCEFTVTRFKILEIPQNLRSNLYEEAVQDLKSVGSHIQFSTKVKAMFMSPVYHEQEFRMLWVEVLLRATVFELFFIYFIDKSISILMRASEKIVNGDIVYSPQSDSSRSSSISGTTMMRQKPQHFFYNKEDLEFLTSKSYVTYGRVIKELRNSINLYSPEFPARMSFFSAWACYTNPQSDLETFGLMIRGTLVLLKNTLSQCIAEKVASFSMHREFSMFEVFVRQSLYPDYNFNVVQNLAADFRDYKAYVDKLINLHEDGWSIDDEIQSVVSDPIFRHDFHELNKFITKLLNHFYPQISAQNRHYKAAGNYEQDQNIFFVSPSLIFKMTYEWFYSYPDEKMYVSSKINPLKKVMYMFFHALAKCLTHTLTPIKSISLADACNVTCTKVGTELSKPDHLEDVNYQPLKPILRNLIRTIRFFDTRSSLLSFCVFKESVLDDEYVKAAPSFDSTEWEHNDVVQILPAKLKVREKQIENFSQSIFAAHNFPFPEELYTDPITADLIHSETERQHHSLQNEEYTFDYSLGLANHDFNPNEIVDYYCSKKKAELDSLKAIPHVQLSGRIDHLLSARDAISSCSKSNSHHTT